MPTVSSLTAASTPLTGSETVYLVQGGNSRRATVAQVQAATATSSRVNLQTEVVAAAQTSIPFTGIPTWVNRVTVLGRGLSTSGTSTILLRVGDGAIVTSGYLGAITQTAGATPATARDTTGCRILSTVAAANVMRFRFTISRQSGNLWVIDGGCALSDADTTARSFAEISLAGNLDRVAITTAGGTDTFDAGAVNISWE